MVIIPLRTGIPKLGTLVIINSSGFVYPEENTAVWVRLSSHQLREPNVNKIFLSDNMMINKCIRKRGRVADCTALEMRRLERVREFESHRFRQKVF